MTESQVERTVVDRQQTPQEVARITREALERAQELLTTALGRPVSLRVWVAGIPTQSEAQAVAQAAEAILDQDARHLTRTTENGMWGWYAVGDDLNPGGIQISIHYDRREKSQAPTAVTAGA